MAMFADRSRVDGFFIVSLDDVDRCGRGDDRTSAGRAGRFLARRLVGELPTHGCYIRQSGGNGNVRFCQEQTSVLKPGGSF